MQSSTVRNVFRWIAGLSCLVLLPQTVRSQWEGQALVDSLSDALARHRAADTATVNLHIGLSDAYTTINTALGLQHGQKALALARSLGYRIGESDALNVIGLNALERADYPTALHNFFQSLRIREDQGDLQRIAKSQNNIGRVYAGKEWYDKALLYHNLSYRTLRRLRDTLGMAKTLLNIGLTYELRHSRDTAGRYLDTADAYYKQATDMARAARSFEVEALAIGNSGNISNRKRNYEDAIKKDLTALRIYEVLGDRHGIVRNLGNIGTCYLDAAVDTVVSAPASPHIPAGKRARLDLAIRYLRNAVDSAKQVGFTEAVMFFSDQLSNAYAEAGRDAEALVAYRDYLDASDSVKAVESKTRIAELETEREAMLAEKQIQLDKLEVAKKRNERIYFIIGLALLAMVIFFVLRERKKSERLLLNILPEKIADRLKRREHPIADSFAGASILFIDMVGFTSFAEQRDPKETVRILNDIFTQFDALAEEHGLEKIKTIGDAYMAVSGIPEPRPKHADAAAGMALAAKRVIQNYTTPDGERIGFRIGIDCGPVVAGVIGRKKFIYDLWGDPVNTAARMESSGVVGEVHCTDRFKNCVEGSYLFVPRGQHVVKGKGVMETWLLREANLTSTTSEAIAAAGVYNKGTH